MALDDLLNRINKLEAFNPKQAIHDILNENGEILVAMLKKQLRIGEDGNDREITLKRKGGIFPFYSDFTIKNKERYGQGLGKETDYVTLYFSGVFYNSIYVFSSGEDFIFDSDVPYFLDIISKTGDEVMHLNKKHLKEFSEKILKPQLAKKWSEAFKAT